MRAGIALLAGIFALAGLFVGPAAPSSERAEQCRATLVYRGVTYHGLNAAHLGLRAGRAAGVALEPQCNDTSNHRRIPVRRVVGVRTRVALARRDVPTVIYVAADRCRTAVRPAALLRCLRRR